MGRWVHIRFWIICCVAENKCIGYGFRSAKKAEVEDVREIQWNETKWNADHIERQKYGAFGVNIDRMNGILGTK